MNWVFKSLGVGGGGGKSMGGGKSSVGGGQIIISGKDRVNQWAAGRCGGKWVGAGNKSFVSRLLTEMY